MPIKMTDAQLKKLTKNFNGELVDCNSGTKISIKVRSALMTQFLLDWEKFTGQRVTPELIRSPLFKDMQKKYINLFAPLLVEQEMKP
jgi:hypothetical protein